VQLSAQKPTIMARQNPQRDNSQQRNQNQDSRKENTGNRTSNPSSRTRKDEASITSKVDASNKKDSRTGIRKEGKDQGGDYEMGRS
jgi:hypothetical protein